MKCGCAPLCIRSPGKEREAMSGVQFPVDGSGKRASTPVAKAIWVQAFQDVVSSQKVGALKAEKNWRKNYGKYIWELTREQVLSPKATLQVCEKGLEAVHNTFEFVRGTIHKRMSDAMSFFTDVPLTAEIASLGEAEFSAESAISVPWGENKRKYSGKNLVQLVRSEVQEGHMEPDVLTAFEHIVENGADWRNDLKDTFFVLFGATSELCPLQTLLVDFGLNVVAIARPNPKRQKALIDAALKAPAGATLTLPVLKELDEEEQEKLSDPEFVASVAGADIIEFAPEIANWLCQLHSGKKLVIGSYIYMDGADHVRASVAMDAVLKRVLENRESETSIAYLGSPATIYPIPEAAWQESNRRRKEQRPWWHNLTSPVLGPYKPNTADPVFADKVNEDAPGAPKRIYLYNGISVTQGPNYLLAKTIQNWRAVLSRHQKHIVSVNMAPTCKTDSVMHVRMVAAAVNGMKLFPPLVAYEPGTAKSIMGLLLIYDLSSKDTDANPAKPLRNPMDIFRSLAVHGGLWRAPYSMDSTGTTAALLGWAA